MATPTYAIGQRLTADLLTTLASHLPVVYTKASTTNRISTTTYAADTELTSIPLAIGTYQIELMIFWLQTGSTTPKLKTQWSFSGTWGNPVRACIGAGAAQVGNPGAVTDATMAGFAATTQDAVYSTSTSGSFSVAREIVYNANVTVAGNLAMQWAQNVSTASNVSVVAGTSFEVRLL